MEMIIPPKSETKAHKRTLTVDRAAEYAGCHRRTIWRLVKLGILPPYQVEIHRTINNRRKSLWRGNSEYITAIIMRLDELSNKKQWREWLAQRRREWDSISEARANARARAQRSYEEHVRRGLPAQPQIQALDTNSEYVLESCGVETAGNGDNA